MDDQLNAEMQSMANKMQWVNSHLPLPADHDDDEVVVAKSCSSSIRQGMVKNFDVFINHRGPDTKKTLAFHIYDMLKDRGVAVFLDTQEFEAGDCVLRVIEETIHSAKVHVCIFSSGYAESVWCLKELEMILHRYEMGKSVLIPIFYDVKPSEVQFLQGTFGQGFQKHSGRHSSRAIDGWRNALRKASKISGYEGQGENCREVVNNVCQQLGVGSVHISNKAIGIEDRLCSLRDDIMRCRNQGHSLTLVEITGIGGMGKTTFAKCLYNQIYFIFERHCFVEDVNGVIEKEGVNAIHKQLINKLFRDNLTINGNEGKQILNHRLQNVDILVVLDNINRENCLSRIFIKDDIDLCRGSVIIVTSRESGVLVQDPEIARYGKNLISMSKLDFYTSRTIFCHYAFGGIESLNTQLDDLIDNIVKKCDGVPLALALLGRHVYKKDPAYWQNFWNAMRYSLPPDMKRILRFTYDNLDTELEKCLFLDIAIFLRFERVDLLKKLRSKDDANDAKVCFALDNLEMKLLIDTHNGNLGMHDLLVDLGRTIVEDESFCPGNRSRLWHPSDIREVLSENKGTDKIKGLSLVWKGKAAWDEDENGDPCPWSSDAFSGMSSLEILILDGNCLEGTCYLIFHPFVSEGDLSKISKRLLWIRWTNFPLQCIPSALCLKYLRVLSLSHGRNTLLWEHSAKEAPVNLRELILLGCSKLQRLPEFAAKFRHLSSMTFESLASLETLPDSFGLLQALKKLYVSKCQALKQLPETMANLKSLVELCLTRCSRLKLLPRSFGQLPKLQALYLKLCLSLEALPEKFGNLQNLKYLEMDSCCKLKFLPPSFKELPQIQSVKLLGCCNLEISGYSFEQMTTLERLNITTYCTKCHVSCMNSVGHSDLICMNRGLLSPVLTGVEILPICMENLQKLERVRLEDLHLHQSMGNFNRLCQLAPRRFWNQQELPHSIGSLSSLQVLSLDVCWSLHQLPESLGNLSRLKTLFIRGCWNLHELPSTIGNLQNLEGLYIVDCPALKGLPFTLGNLSELRGLKVRNCSMVEAIHTDAMFKVEEIIITNCVNLKTVFGIGGCRSLRKLQVQDCDYLSFPDIIVPQPNKLEQLSLSLNEQFLKTYNCTVFENLLSLIGKPLLSGYWRKPFLWKVRKPEPLYLKAKVGPCFFPMLHEKLRRQLVAGTYNSFWFSELALHDGNLTLQVLDNNFPEGSFICIICFMTAVYAHSYADNILPPNPAFWFCLNDTYQSMFTQFSFGEEIHFAITHINHVARGHFIKVKPDVDGCYPAHEVVAEKGWMIFVPATEKDKHIPAILDLCKTFYSELHRQRLLSSAWSKLPSELHLFKFSALDIANSKIAKIYRHCDTCIMEEETDFLQTRRQCLFQDDQALGLRQKGSFVPFNVFESDVQMVANFYELSISISFNGKVGRTRILQQNVSNSSEGKEICRCLHNLLQGKSSKLKSEALRRTKTILYYESQVSEGYRLGDIESCIQGANKSNVVDKSNVVEMIKGMYDIP